MSTTVIITSAEIYHLAIPLVRPFTTSFGTMIDRNIVLVALKDESGKTGWGEAPALDLPLYNAETPATVMGILADALLPTLKNKILQEPEGCTALFAAFKGNEFAKSAVVMAVYDLFGQKLGKTLPQMLGASKDTLTIGRTISIHKAPEMAVEEARLYYDQGIRYLKLKIKPGHDVDHIKALQKAFPDAIVMVDANASYELCDETIRCFKAMDELNIDSIEQPLQHNDIVDHAHLQEIIKTKIALDESAVTLHDVEKAIELGSARLINIKIPRVGGFSNALRMNNLCKKNGMPTWVGGMVESPIGMYANLAMAMVDNFDYPIDFIDPVDYMKDFGAFFVNKPYAIKGDKLTPRITKHGLGLELDWDLLLSYTKRKI